MVDDSSVFESIVLKLEGFRRVQVSGSRQEKKEEEEKEENEEEGEEEEENQE